MRSILKSWQDCRPGWTRRVRWYEPGVSGETIRLCFEDADGKANRLYAAELDAQADWECFKSGSLSVVEVLR